MWCFKISLRLFGLRGAYGLLYIVCVYYVLFDSGAVRGALAYLNRRFPDCGYFKKRAHLYRLFISQGKLLIDRFAAISGAVKFELELRGYDHLVSLLKEPGQGAVLLTAHVGNWQIAMTQLGRLDKTVYLVMRPEDNQAVRQVLNISGEHQHIKIISPEEHLGGVVEIMNVLKAGNLVSIMGDRSYGFSAVDVTFVGDTARFPYGAFHIAAASGSPMVVLLCAKVSLKKYVVDVSNIIQPRYSGRRNKVEQISKWVQQFASLLDQFIESHPYQCFLFHDVWKKMSGSAAKDPGTGENIIQSKRTNSGPSKKSGPGHKENVYGRTRTETVGGNPDQAETTSGNQPVA